MDTKYLIEKISLSEYKKFIKTLNTTEIDILGNDFSSCWLYAYFVHKMLCLPIENYECMYNLQINNSNDFNLSENGIYSFYIENNIEFHHFVLLVDNEKIILLSTYGGYNRLIVRNFQKEMFVIKMRKLLDEKNNKELMYVYYELLGINYKSSITLDEKMTIDSDSLKVMQCMYCYRFISSTHIELDSNC